jgi:hypothetical protein
MDSARVRAFIDQAFARAYGAPNAAGYAEYLVVPHRAALGYRRAGTEPLFLEQYLDQPIEQAVSAVLGRRVGRDRIIEIGNLAADDAWSMIALWGEAANDLGGSNEVVVATLTASLRRMFARIGVPVRELAPADPARLGTAASEWGDYYLADPRVCAGPIGEGQQAIATFLARRRRERDA